MDSPGNGRTSPGEKNLTLSAPSPPPCLAASSGPSARGRPPVAVKEGDGAETANRAICYHLTRDTEIASGAYTLSHVRAQAGKQVRVAANNNGRDACGRWDGKTVATRENSCSPVDQDLSKQAACLECSSSMTWRMEKGGCRMMEPPQTRLPVCFPAGRHPSLGPRLTRSIVHRVHMLPLYQLPL